MRQSLAERIRSELVERQIDAELRSHIEQWLRADKDFNVWFLVTTKRALADDELMALLDGYRESQDIMEVAWERFLAKRDDTILIEGITQSIHRMDLLRDRS